MSANRSRRLFLAGAGASIALPFLPSALWSRRAGAATATPQRRFLSWFIPNGVVMYNFTPTTVGTGWALPSILAPLAPVQKKIAILTGLDHEALALPQPSPTGNPPGGHGSGTGIMLNMMSVDGHATDATRESVDQLLLPVLNATNPPRMSSMQIGLQGDNGLCDRADCSFSRTMSWKAGAALPNIYDPSLLFDAMFSGATTTTSMPTPASTAAAVARAANQQSILDGVVAQATSLATKLNTADKAKLEQYLTSVRDIEMQLQIQATAKPLTCTIPARPASPGVLNFNRGITPSTVLEADMPLFVQLMGLAFTCDITRSITYMVGNGTSNNDYQFLIGSSTPHHGTSHHNGDATKLADLTQIDTWEIKQFATLLANLDATIDTDGTSTVLDNTTVYLSSDIGDGATHNHWDMPVIMAGGASGKLKLGGQHINYTDGTAGRGPALTLPRAGTATNLVGPRNPNTNTAQALLSILSAHGLPATKIGLYTGTALTEILA